MIETEAKNYEFDVNHELLTLMINVETILKILVKKKLISEKDFLQMKKEVINTIKKENPGLFEE